MILKKRATEISEVFEQAYWYVQLHGLKFVSSVENGAEALTALTIIVVRVLIGLGPKRDIVTKEYVGYIFTVEDIP
jgi:hypothetical protein